MLLPELALSTIWLGQPHNGMSNSLARNNTSHYGSHNNECKLNVHEQIIQMTTLGPVQAFFFSTSAWKYYCGVICTIPQYGYIQDRPALWQYVTLTWPKRLGRGGVGQTLSEHVVQQYCQAAVHPHGAMGWTHFPLSKPEGMP